MNLNGQPNVENPQTVIPEYTVQPKKRKKKKIGLGIAVVIILIVVVVFAGISKLRNRGLNLDKFDKENRNTISTSWFEEYATDESEFSRYEILGNTEEEPYDGYAVLNQQAVDIDNHDMLDGIYLSTYEDKKELERYAYADILKIAGKDYATQLMEALKSPSEDFYYIELCGGMFGNHSYCFYLRGNSMVYAIGCLDSDENAYEYLLGCDEATGMFGIPVYNSENSNLVNFSDQFLEDFNNR